MEVKLAILCIRYYLYEVGFQKDQECSPDNLRGEGRREVLELLAEQVFCAFRSTFSSSEALEKTAAGKSQNAAKRRKSPSPPKGEVQAGRRNKRRGRD